MREHKKENQAATDTDTKRGQADEEMQPIPVNDQLWLSNPLFIIFLFQSIFQVCQDYASCCSEFIRQQESVPYLRKDH